MKVFLMMGQSNMAGRGAIGEVPEIRNEKCFMFRDGNWVLMQEPISTDATYAGISLAASFAECYSNHFHEEIGLVPCAVGGTKLERHMPGADLYENTIKNARLALQTGTLSGILWHQGESDSFYFEDAKDYGERFVTMIKTLKKDLGVYDIPVITGELCESFLKEYISSEKGRMEYVGFINEALKKTCDKIPKCAFVSTYDLADRGDKLHFNSKSLRILGKRYFDAYLNLYNIEKE